MNLFMVKNLRNFFAFLHFYVFGFFCVWSIFDFLRVSFAIFCVFTFFFFRFCRLCNSSKVCRDLIRLSGVDRLVELCQNPSERNYSDAVLVSCLAVLRRLNANLEQSEELQSILHQLKALNLIRTNLVDSFMEYSTKQESLV